MQVPSKRDFDGLGNGQGLELESLPPMNLRRRSTGMKPGLGEREASRVLKTHLHQLPAAPALGWLGGRVPGHGGLLSCSRQRWLPRPQSQ